jgi:hypothetical protein
LTAKELRQWAAEEVGDCDCAGGCWCDDYRKDVIRHYRAGLRAALKAAGLAPVDGGFLAIHSAIHKLIAEAASAEATP